MTHLKINLKVCCLITMKNYFDEMSTNNNSKQPIIHAMINVFYKCFCVKLCQYSFDFHNHKKTSMK